ncbi:MRPL43 [Auxenochlorella protothecoides x Auxenochlorella symbiontica]
MARQGVWQLQKLVLNYCEFSGSSRGARVFVEKLWPEFTAGNPQLDATLHVHRGRHPNLTAQYLNGRVRTVGLRNEDPDEIMRQAILLRSSTGRKAALQVKTRQVSRNPSIQGPWTPAVQDALKQKQPPSA